MDKRRACVKAVFVFGYDCFIVFGRPANSFQLTQKSHDSPPAGACTQIKGTRFHVKLVTTSAWKGPPAGRLLAHPSLAFVKVRLGPAIICTFYYILL